MPLGPASYMGAGAQAPAPNAGIPIQQTMAPGVPDEAALSELMMMLKGGQAGAEKLMQVLAVLAASTVPQMQQQGGAQPPQQAGPPSIQGLLG